MTAEITAALSNIGWVPIDQSGRILTNGQEQFIVTVAGNGSGGYNGDNRAATSAQITAFYGFNVDGAGDNYFADYFNNRVRKVTMSTGNITTIAGSGVGYYDGNNRYYDGDNRAATSAQLNGPSSVTLDKSGNVYIADKDNNRI